MEALLPPPSELVSAIRSTCATITAQGGITVRQSPSLHLASLGSADTCATRRLNPPKSTSTSNQYRRRTGSASLGRKSMACGCRSCSTRWRRNWTSSGASSRAGPRRMRPVWCWLRDRDRAGFQRRTHGTDLAPGNHPRTTQLTVIFQAAPSASSTSSAATDTPSTA
ncbi:hypothetical protein BJY59DRAFT_232928 [Rhodotorula toruloides]